MGCFIMPKGIPNKYMNMKHLEAALYDASIAG